MNTDLDRLAKAFRRIADNALPKFNWAKSALDAEAIAAINEGLIELNRVEAVLAETKGDEE